MSIPAALRLLAPALALSIGGLGCSGSSSTDTTKTLTDPQGRSVELTTSSGRFDVARRVDNPDPNNSPMGVSFDDGFYDFTIVGLDAGSAVQVTLKLSSGSTPNRYFKFHDGGFTDFAFNGTEGATFNGNTVTLTIVDGGVGDDDGVANGRIVDPGGPGCSGQCGGSAGAGPNGTTSPAAVNAAVAGSYNLIYSENTAGGPFTDGQMVSMTVNAAGTLVLADGRSLSDPFFRDIGAGSPHAPEIIWLDAANQIEYALTNNDNGVFNEINVGDANNPQSTSGIPGFLGQLRQNSAGGGSDTSPNDFFFTAAENQPRSTQVQSSVATITGIDATASGTVTGGEVSLGCNGTFTSAAFSVNNNDTICVRHTTSADFDTSTQTDVVIGGVTGSFISFTETDPNAGGGMTTTHSISGNIAVTPDNVFIGSWELRVNGGFSNDGSLTDGNVTYGTGIADGASYEIRVFEEDGFSCSVTNGSGTVSGADVTGVNIGCSQDTEPTDPGESAAVNGWKFGNPLPQGESLDAILGGTTETLVTGKLGGFNVTARSSVGDWRVIGRRNALLGFRSICAFSGKYYGFQADASEDVAVGLYSSSNAIDWSPVATTGVDFSDRFGPQLDGMVCGSTTIMASGAHFVSGELKHFFYASSDGTAWAETAVQDSNGNRLEIGQVASDGNGTIVNGLGSYSSDNGATWQAASISDNGNPVSAVAANIVWDGNQFVGVFGRDSYTSSNGVMWTKHSGVDQDPITQRGFELLSLASDGKGTVFVAQSDTTNLLRSSDGTAFVKVALPATSATPTDILDIHVAADGTVLLANRYGLVYSSSDGGQTFVLETGGQSSESGSNTITLRAFASNGSFAVAGGLEDAPILGSASVDGWAVQPLPTFTQNNRTFSATDRYVGAHWTGDRFILQGHGRFILSSSDGQAWSIVEDGNFGSGSTRDPARVTFAQSGNTIVNSKFVRSTNGGVDFDAAITAPSGQFTTVRHDGSNFVAVGQQAASSSDGNAWTVSQLVFDQAAQDIGVDRIESFDVKGGLYIGTMFGQVLSSSDAINWTLLDPVDQQFADIGGEPLTSADCVVDVVMANFYLACDSGLLFRSANGTSWQQLMGNSSTIDFNAGTVSTDATLNTTVQDLAGVAEFNGNVIVYGEGGAILYMPAAQ